MCVSVQQVSVNEDVLSLWQWLLLLVALDVRTCSFFVLCPAVGCCLVIRGRYALQRAYPLPFSVKYPQMQNVFFTARF